MEETRLPLLIHFTDSFWKGKKPNKKLGLGEDIRFQAPRNTKINPFGYVNHLAKGPFLREAIAESY
ncbi:hypothetical protein LEMLEM_LOCUS13602 [Lemmus lemmus]